MSESIFIIVPAFNEGTVVGTTIQELLGLGYKVVVVDDASTDNTPGIISRLPVHYLRHKVNLGQGAALQTGIVYALKKNADYLVTFDADGQHVAADITLMLEHLKLTGADICFGSRFMNKEKQAMTLIRKMLLHFARYLNFFLTGILLTDAHNGLRVMNRKAASAISIKENRMAHATEILIKVAKRKLSYIEVPVRINYSAYSVKKGQKNFHSFKVLQDIFLYKIFK